MRCCRYGGPRAQLYSVQFHPEVVHTTRRQADPFQFLFDVCGCVKDWDPRHRIPLIEDEIRATVGDRNVFFFVSGGVDSTVAFTLCLRALGVNRVRGIYVDTGLMREGETAFVRQMFESLGAGSVSIEHVEPQFLTPLAAVRDPEEKRQIIGEEFVRVQERGRPGDRHRRAHRLEREDVRPRDARVQHVTDDPDVRALERPETAAQRVDVEQRLRGVLVLAVPGVQHRHVVQRGSSAGAPARGSGSRWRPAQWALSVSTVSLSDSPFSTEEPEATKFTTSALSRLAASSKELRVRVLAS